MKYKTSSELHLVLDYRITNPFVTACYNGNFSAHVFLSNLNGCVIVKTMTYILWFVDLSRMFAPQIADGKTDMMDEFYHIQFSLKLSL